VIKNPRLEEMAMTRRGNVLAAAVVALGLAGCEYDKANGPTGMYDSAPRSQFQVVRASGDLTNALTEFRALLGDPPNGATPGPLDAGRREIKWDGVKAELTNTDALPADNFRANGLLYVDLGTGLRVSDNDFIDIDPSYPAQFNAFSPPKTFAPIGNENSEVTFVVPGSATPAAVTGFGVVFSDVDRVGSASIKLFTADGHSLGQYQAPVRTDANGFSFVGVVFKDPIVAKVVISSGQAPLARGVLDVSDGGNRDLVVFDDLLFGEPQGL
jgi:hypothetical protein